MFEHIFNSLLPLLAVFLDLAMLLQSQDHLRMSQQFGLKDL